jgi:hypothetical protein
MMSGRSSNHSKGTVGGRRRSSAATEAGSKDLPEVSIFSEKRVIVLLCPLSHNSSSSDAAECEAHSHVCALICFKCVSMNVCDAYTCVFFQSFIILLPMRQCFRDWTHLGLQSVPKRFQVHVRLGVGYKVRFVWYKVFGGPGRCKRLADLSARTPPLVVGVPGYHTRAKHTTSQRLNKIEVGWAVGIALGGKVNFSYCHIGKSRGHGHQARQVCCDGCADA